MEFVKLYLPGTCLLDSTSDSLIFPDVTLLLLIWWIFLKIPTMQYSMYLVIYILSNQVCGVMECDAYCFEALTAGLLRHSFYFVLALAYMKRPDRVV